MPAAPLTAAATTAVVALEQDSMPGEVPVPAVGVTKNAIYVCDTYNRRAVRVEYAYAAEAACAVP